MLGIAVFVIPDEVSSGLPEWCWLPVGHLEYKMFLG